MASHPWVREMARQSQEAEARRPKPSQAAMDALRVGDVVKIDPAARVIDARVFLGRDLLVGEIHREGQVVGCWHSIALLSVLTTSGNPDRRYKARWVRLTDLLLRDPVEDILDDLQFQAFQRMLDEDTSSHHTRGVLADWLEEQGHPWAAGWKWMWENQRFPEMSSLWGWTWYFFSETEDAWKELGDGTCIPTPLFAAIYGGTVKTAIWYTGKESRLDAETALCRAIAANPNLISQPAEAA